MRKLLREVLAYVLILIFSKKKSERKGILSIYFHNPSKELFERIMKWLLKQGYTFISIKELEKLIELKSDTQKLVFISFDDGWVGNLALIETIEKFQVPVTIFIPTNPVKEGNFWWEYAIMKGQQKHSGINRLQDFKRLPENIFREKISLLKTIYNLKRSCISLEELKKVAENKMITIGSHTVTHPILKQFSHEFQVVELRESKHVLSIWLNEEINYLAYPNGDFNEKTLEIVCNCGYRLCFTTFPALIDTKKVDPFLIPRFATYDKGGYYENISKILGIWQKVFK